MTYTPGLNGGRINATISGNTAGAGALVSTGTVTFAGGNNITLSQAGNAITISGANGGGASGSNTLGMSNLGNTIGTSGVISGSALQFAFAGGNNVTLSQSINASSATITISAANQTVQTQNLHNMTLSGNTAGAMAHVSSGTLTLAGGDNITLSQAGNAITISGGAGGAAGSNTFGASNLGNTVGTSGVVSGSAVQFAFAGGNNVTLSQSLNGSSGTITVSAANQTAQTQSNIQAFYDGANSISTGTIRVSNANGVSFGINGQTLTASHDGITSQSNQNVSLYALGNTTQNSSTLLNASNLSFNGLGAATMGFSNGSIQVSAPTQTVQTQNLHNLTLSGNTAGAMAHVSSGTLTLAGGDNITLSQAGNAITISGGAGGAGFTAGVSTIGNTAGDTGTVSNRLVLAGGNNVTLSQSTGAGGATVSIIGAAGGGGNDLDYYQNMDRGTSVSLATAHKTLMLQRLNQENNEFGHNITANTFLLNMTANMTATSLSSSHSISVSLGIYLDNTTALSLVNSASTSWGFTAETGNTKYYHGPRWISFVSSQWSSAPNFASGNDYVMGIVFSSSNYGPPISYIGQNYMHSLQRSGTIGTTVATNTSMAHGNFWNAMHSASQNALPATIASNVVNRNNATAYFMPHIVMNNRYSGTL
jgi:fibronectin-binding autotransporter adhesin